MLGDKDKGESTLSGDVVDVYDDGVRKIEIYAVRFTQGGREILDPPRIHYVDKDRDIEDGGYLTPEEYRKWNRGE